MPCPNLEYADCDEPVSALPQLSRYTHERICWLPGKLGTTGVNPLVEHNMIDGEGHQAAYRLNILNLLGNREEELEAGNTGVYSDMPDHRADTSFSQQMHEVTADMPDVILATYRSAVPILSAVEGYCTARQLPIPILDYVDVSTDYDTTYSRKHEYPMKIDREVKRLRSLIERSHVVVIDEFFSSGSALWEGGRVAALAGAQTVRGVMGHWYRKIGHTSATISADDIKGQYHDAMFAIGLRAGETPVYPKLSPIASRVVADYRSPRF